VCYLKDSLGARYDLPESLVPTDKRPPSPLPMVRGDGQVSQFTTADGGPDPGPYTLAGSVPTADAATLDALVAEVKAKLATATLLGFEEGAYSWERAIDTLGSVRGTVSATPVQSFSHIARLTVKVAVGSGGAPVVGITSPASTITLPDGTTPTGGTGAITPRVPWLEVGGGGTYGPIPYVTDFIAGSTVTGHPQVVMPDLNIGYGAEGDLAISAFALTDNTAATITPPAGWSLVERTDNTTNGLTLVTYSKVAEAADSGTFQTFTITGGDTSKAHVGSLVMYRAVGSIGVKSEDAPAGLASWVTLPALETTRPLVREVVVVGMRGVTGASGPSVDQLAPYKVDQDYSAGIAGVSLISTARPEGGLLLDSAGDPGEFTISTGDTQDAYRVVQRLALYPTVN
jgi:hypothetical protein